MPVYQAPPQVSVTTEAGVFNPDGRNVVRTTAEYLENDFTVSVSRADFANPNTAVTQFMVDFELSPSTSATVGASVAEGGVVPELSVSQVVLDEKDMTATLMLSRGLNDSDSRAVEALIQQNVIGGELRFGDVSEQLSVAFNSDDVEVYENKMSVKLTESNFLTLNSYMRASSGRSDYYWDPRFYSQTGVLIAVPVIETENAEVMFGVQPSVVYSVRDDGGDTVRLAFPVGLEGEYRPSDDLSIKGNLSYSYGVSASLGLNYTF